MSAIGKALRENYRIARAVRTVYALRSPRTAVRRAKNIVLGKALARVGFWRLWR